MPSGIPHRRAFAWIVLLRPQVPGRTADGFLVARTHRSFQRPRFGPIVAVAALVLLGVACSATPSWVPVETAERTGVVSGLPADFGETATGGAIDADGPGAPTELAFVDEGDPSAPSDDFCIASANIWIHTAALNLLGPDPSAEVTQVAMANVAEWLERATLFGDEDQAPQRLEMFDAFEDLRATVGTDFDFDWTAFQSSTEYANDPSAVTYEAARDDLVSFVNARCDTMRVSDLRSEAEARAEELRTTFAVSPSTVVESDSLPGHMIFTHSSGRLIASFPQAWDHEEGRGDAIVDLIASPDIERFLAGDALDGVRLELIEAATIEDFRARIDATMVASSCERTNDLLDNGTVRTNITQSYVCEDHGASIVGQYDEARALGLVIQATFDRPEASRADLIRLATIANSALWS